MDNLPRYRVHHEATMALLELAVTNGRSNVHEAQGELLINKCQLLHPNWLVWNLVQRQYALP